MLSQPPKITTNSPSAARSSWGATPPPRRPTSTGQCLIRDKRAAVKGFFINIQKLPLEVDPRDVNTWRAELEKRLKPASVYAQISKVSSFYEWLMKDARFEGMAFNNPVQMARPKAPRDMLYRSSRSGRL
jgi:hypothetical protein